AGLRRADAANRGAVQAGRFGDPVVAVALRGELQHPLRLLVVIPATATRAPRALQLEHPARFPTQDGADFVRVLLPVLPPVEPRGGEGGEGWRTGPARGERPPAPHTSPLFRGAGAPAVEPAGSPRNACLREPIEDVAPRYTELPGNGLG